MKLRMIVEAREAATRSLESMVSFEAGFALATFIDNISIAYSEYIKKQNALVSKYGQDPDPSKEEEKNIQGKFVSPKSENFPKFRKEIDELLESEIEVAFTKFKPENFKGEKMPGAYVVYLKPFFE